MRKAFLLARLMLWRGLQTGVALVPLQSGIPLSYTAAAGSCSGRVAELSTLSAATATPHSWVRAFINPAKKRGDTYLQRSEARADCVCSECWHRHHFLWERPRAFWPRLLQTLFADGSWVRATANLAKKRFRIEILSDRIRGVYLSAHVLSNITASTLLTCMFNLSMPP